MTAMTQHLFLIVTLFLVSTLVTHGHQHEEKLVLTEEELALETDRLIHQEFGSNVSEENISLLPNTLVSNRILSMMMKVHGGKKNLQSFLQNYFMDGKKDKAKFKAVQLGISIGRRLIRTKSLMQTVIRVTCHFLRRKEEQEARKQNLVSVCDGVSKLFAPTIFFIFNKSPVSSQDMTALLLGYKDLGRDKFEKSKHLNWKISLPPPKPRTRQYQDNRFHNTQDQVIKFAHFSDVHLDVRYSKGSEVNCPLPNCCRVSSNNKNSEVKNAAGPWGEIQGDCDVPVVLAESMLHALNKTLGEDDRKAIAYVIDSGDTTPHDVWQTSRQQIIDTSSRWKKLIRDSLSSASGVIPLIPVLGNHESSPVNLFSPTDDDSINDDISSRWLYRAFYDDVWKEWFDLMPRQKNTSNIEESFKKSGSYSVYYPHLNLRIIVLNTVYCASENYWNLYQPVDLGGVLSFMVRELTAAESLGQFVHIVSHGAADGGCTESWLSNYLNIVDRFSHVIQASFFGHSHRNIMRLYVPSSSTEKTAKGVAFSAGSVLPDHVNPCFKIYSMDGKTGVVLDQDTYWADIQESNDQNMTELAWKKLYSSRESYELPDLSVNSVSSLYSRMTSGKHQDKVDAYFTHYHRASHTTQYANCDRDCRMNMVHEIPVTDPLVSLFGRV